MKNLLPSILAFLFAFTLILPARDVEKSAPYFDPATVNLKALLPDPPANGSPATHKEIDLILRDQAARTPEEVARIKQEVHLDVHLFANVLGSWFTQKNLPVTTALFERVDAAEHPVILSAKKYWDRPRPFLQDKRIHPPIDPPQNASYPSGHSTVGNLDAMILAELVGDRKAQLLALGQQIGDDRIIAGVHFPSNVTAGETLAHDLFVRLNASPAFQADLARAKAEIAAVRAKP